MRAVRRREIAETLGSTAFATWYGRYNDLHQHIASARDQLGDLLAESSVLGFRADSSLRSADDLLFRAGECEDLAARAHAEFAEIENNSFEFLSSFESQRTLTSNVWGEVDRLEKELEDTRRSASELRARLDAARRGEGAGEQERLAAELRDVEARVVAHSRDAQAARARLEREVSVRDELWLEVEETWSAAFRANMARSEYVYQGRRVRREAETLFARADEEHNRVDALHSQVEAQEGRIAALEAELAALLEDGRSQFGCTLIDAFMYWACADDVHAAFCVPLIDEPEHLNIQVVALQVYQVDRARGLDFIEPVPEDDVNEGDDDPRLEAFFVGPPTA